MESWVPMTKTRSPSPEPLLLQLRALALKDVASPQITVQMNAAEALDYEHIHDYKTLEQDLSRTAVRTLKNLERGRKYDRVLVLGIYWHQNLTDRDYIVSHAQELLEVFDKKYNYKVEELVLEKEDAYTDLNGKLVDIGRTLGSKTQENLFILYYSGHGGFAKGDSRARLWQPSLNDAAETIDWYKLQEQLGAYNFDILFLLDCCYAMAMPTETLNWRQRCEVVGASGPREKAGGKPEYSFTAALTQLLREDFEASGETNAWRLGTIMKSRDYKSTLKSTPDYKQLSEGRSTIPLVPLPQDEEKKPSNGTSSAGSSTLASTLTCSDARILFSVATANVPKAIEFERMLSLLPPSVTDIKVGVYSQKLLDTLGFFRSNSALAFLSVPVWFWCAMVSNPAYKYIGLVRSENLLEEAHREAEQQAGSVKYCTRGMQTEVKKEPVLPPPNDPVFTKRNQGHHDIPKHHTPEKSLNESFRKDFDYRRTTVPWNSSRKAIFSREDGWMRRKIEKETANISTTKIEQQLGKYTMNTSTLFSRANSKHSKMLAVS